MKQNNKGVLHEVRDKAMQIIYRWVTPDWIHNPKHTSDMIDELAQALVRLDSYILDVKLIIREDEKNIIQSGDIKKLAIKHLTDGVSDER